MKKRTHSVPRGSKLESFNDDLRAAAKAGDETNLKALLLRPECDPMSSSQAGQSALMRAAARRHVDCIDFLLPVSDPLAQESAGMTALIHAAEGKSLAQSADFL